MADNTYGGKTLHELGKEVLKHQKGSQNPGQLSSTNNQSSSSIPSACPLPGMAARSPTRGRKVTPVPQPKPKKLSQPDVRVPPYINITGHVGNVPPPPNHPPPGHQDSELEDDEQEDEYIAPSQLRDDAEEEETESNPIYQNFQTNGIAEPPKYLNVGFAEDEAPVESPSLYQNVDFSAAGKAKPKVRPRVPKKPQTHH